MFDFSGMGTVYLGALLDNVQYNIQLQDAGRLLTPNPDWCHVQISNDTTLQIDLGTIKTQQAHSFEVAFREHTVTYKFIGFPNMYM